jgi:FkbM family methyltransferase
MILAEEPPEQSDPWKKPQSRSAQARKRIQQFIARPNAEKLAAVKRRVGAILGESRSLRLPFGAHWVLHGSRLDDQLASGKFESHEAQLVERFLRKGMTVLDIGAHHGFYTLLASKCVGTAGRVIAFEPSPRERKRLKEHVRINKCRNVEIEPFALGKESGSEELFIVQGQEDWCNSLRLPVVQAMTTTMTVQVKSLDQYLAHRNIAQVDFVKLDVEGAELDVLKGAHGLLRSKGKPVLLVEVFDIRTDPWGYRAREIVQLLARLQYRWFDIGPHGAAEEIGSDLDVYDRNLVAVPEELVHDFVSQVRS